MQAHGVGRGPKRNRCRVYGGWRSRAKRRGRRSIQIMYCSSLAVLCMYLPALLGWKAPSVVSVSGSHGVRHSCLGGAEDQEIKRRNEGPILKGQKQTNAWSVANGRNRRPVSCGRAGDVMGPLEPATTSRVRIGRGAAPWQPDQGCRHRQASRETAIAKLVPRGVRRGDQLTRAWIAGAAGRPNPCRASGTTQPARRPGTGFHDTRGRILLTDASPMHSSLHRQAAVATVDYGPNRTTAVWPSLRRSVSQSVNQSVSLPASLPPYRRVHSPS